MYYMMRLTETILQFFKSNVGKPCVLTMYMTYILARNFCVSYFNFKI